MSYDEDWNSTSNEHIGHNVNDGGFYYSHENVGHSGRFDTFSEAKDNLDYDVIHEIVSRG